MLSLSHTLTGAFLAVNIQNPVLIGPIIFASHYLQDWFPHWDVGTGLSSGKRRRQDAIRMELIELALSGVLIWVIFQAGFEDIKWWAWIGAGIALIPDFLEAPSNFLRWEPGWLKPINELHGAFHHSTPNIFVGLTPQVILWFLIAWMHRG